MRQFIGTGQGRTLAQALDHWRATRRRVCGEIGSQFELNRFMRDWYAAHPGGDRKEALSAWGDHRSRSIEGRGQSHQQARP